MSNTVWFRNTNVDKMGVKVGEYIPSFAGGYVRVTDVVGNTLTGMWVPASEINLGKYVLEELLWPQALRSSSESPRASTPTSADDVV